MLDALVIGVCVASPLGVAITLRAKHFENDERESEGWVWGNRVVAGAWGVGYVFSSFSISILLHFPFLLSVFCLRGHVSIGILGLGRG